MGKITTVWGVYRRFSLQKDQWYEGPVFSLLLAELDIEKIVQLAVFRDVMMPLPLQYRLSTVHFISAISVFYAYKLVHFQLYIALAWIKNMRFILVIFEDCKSVFSWL